ALEGKLAEGVSAVDEDLDAARAGKVHQFPNRHDLAREIGDVGNLDDASPRGHRLLEAIDDVLRRGRWELEGNLLQDHSIAPDPLVPAGEHPGVVLIGDDYLVPRLEIETEDHDLIGFGGIPGDSHFLGVAAELPGQIPPDTFDPGLQGLPHVDYRELVAEPEVPDHLVQDVGGAGAASPVVEVDHGAVGIEGALDLDPEVLVVRPPGPGSGQVPHSPQRLRTEGREGGHGQCTDESPA